MNCLINVNRYDSVPVGTIRSFLSDEEKIGWLKCDGSTVSKYLYVELFEAIGFRFQKMDKPYAGDENFYLPDLKNLFTYWDSNQAIGQNIDSENPVHSHEVTCFDSPAHNHRLRVCTSRENDDGLGGVGGHYFANNNYIGYMHPGGAHEHYGQTDSQGGEEFAPEALRVQYYIKY